MGRGLDKLTAREVSGPKPDGRHSGGGGLYLVISGEGIRKQWVMRYTYAGRTREMGLGAAASVSLAQAREKAAYARSLVAAGNDPISVRAALERFLRRTPTFGEAAEDLMASIEGSFKNEKHKAQWRSTLTTYAKPIWSMGVDQITTDHVLAILNPIWSTKNETASRLRGRIERVLDAAIARNRRSDGNPARWRGHLAVLLPSRKRLARGRHAALPANDLPVFVRRLNAVNGLGSDCTWNDGELTAIFRQSFDIIAEAVAAPIPARTPEGVIRKKNGIWLGRQDSNLGMAVPKTAALPLGDAPTRRCLSRFNRRGQCGRNGFFS